MAAKYFSTSPRLASVKTHRFVGAFERIGEQHADVLVGQSVDDLALELRAQAIDLAQVVGRVGFHLEAAPRHVNHEPLQLEDAQGFTHRPAACPELGGKLDLAQARFRRITPANDSGLDTIGEVIGNRVRQAFGGVEWRCKSEGHP